MILPYNGLMNEDFIFCKIVKAKSPWRKSMRMNKVPDFLDINPVSASIIGPSITSLDQETPRRSNFETLY